MAFKMEKVKLFVDDRESKAIIEELIRLNAEVKVQRLNIADFICSSRVGVEYKKASDFVNSIADGRLLSQTKALKENFERPVIIIEGNEDIFSFNIHPNSIRGVLSTIVIDYGIPILNTRNLKETAALLLALAKREQIKQGKDFSLHAKKPAKLKDMQEYVISSLPKIGTKTAKQLLKKFGSIEAVINASEEELMEINNIGEKKAKEIKRIVEEKYEK